MRKILTVGLMCLLVAACGEPKPKKPPLAAKYTVWLGSAAFASGYKTDKYTQEGDMIHFINKRNHKQMSAPLCSVWQIESN